MVQCSCQGPGLVEIKCPASFIGKIPSAENYPHVELIDKKLKLKKTCEYYFQIQGQLGVTGCQYCDFFVFTFQGNFTIKVYFDETFWSDLVNHLDWFWRKFIAPELLLGKLKKNMDRICQENDIVSIGKPTVCDNSCKGGVSIETQLMVEIDEDIEIEMG